MNFIKDHLDKFILGFFLLLFLAAATILVIVLHAHVEIAAKFLDWMMREFDIFAGGLLGLITGGAAGYALGIGKSSKGAPELPNGQ